MEATGSSKTLVSIYKTTWCHSPEDNLKFHHCENMKYSDNSVSFLISAMSVITHQ
jgi:hypothetical protein